MIESGKLTAAMVLGIVGGIFGILGGLFAMMVGGVGLAIEAEGAGEAAGFGFVAVFIGVAGIVGGAMSRGRPKVAAWLQGGAGILGFIAISAAWLLAGPLLLVGAFLAYRGYRQTSALAP